jgi:hypothetical protein
LSSSTGVDGLDAAWLSLVEPLDGWLVEVPEDWLLPCVEPDDVVPEDELPVEGEVYGVDAGGRIFSNMG